jgi:trehalose 6-phosphate phosphatase
MPRGKEIVVTREPSVDMSHENRRMTISPRQYGLVIFDLDGVVTRTARVHAAAWKAMFDPYLAARGAREEAAYPPFDAESDYRRYVDGKPRYEGVRSFLESRSLALPRGDPADPPERETVYGLGNRKNALFLEKVREGGVEVFDSTVDLIRALREQGVKTAIVSSSKNCAAVLEAAKLAELFDVRVDGTDTARLGLTGKPAPDIFQEAARRLGIAPGRAVVVEDAIAGVEAGRRGGFGCVIGVDRAGQAEDLREAGADAVVADLAEVEVGEAPSASRHGTDTLPVAMDCLEKIRRRASGKRLAIFLDYDGTLTPIVARPEDAVLSAEMRGTLRDLARRFPVAVISGRDLPDVRRMVGLEGIVYAGSHGFDIDRPERTREGPQHGTEFLPALDAAERELRQRLAGIPSARVERKRFSVAVHYRQVDEGDVPAVEEAVDRVRAGRPELRKSGGKKIFELQPDIDWNKGRALLWLLRTLDLDRPDVLPVYLGDDQTDEDAFVALAGCGIGIVVRDEPRPTAASYALDDSEEVRRFLAALISGTDGELP